MDKNIAANIASGIELPPQYYPPSWDDIKKREFAQVCAQFEISQDYAKEARHIICARYKIIIVDNSGSMNVMIKGTSMSRYDELKHFLSFALPILNVDAPNGITLVFLNPIMPPGSTTMQSIFENIHTWSQIEHLFSIAPSGGTPLVSTVKTIMQRYQDIACEQGSLLLIATDGEPTEGKQALYDIVKKRPNPNHFIINFLVCTDCDDEVAYLNDLDKEAVGVDVTDDYHTERKQVLKAGHGKPFTYGDYVLKALVGGASHQFDLMDESKTFKQKHHCIVL